MTTHPFNPPPEDVPRILDDLASPECSLREIAEAYDTTIDGLTLWLARPDIAERFAAAESFAARRVRHAAACQLPAAVRAATNILDLFNSAVERRKLDELSLAAQNTTQDNVASGLPPRLAALELQRRICETARKTSNLLLRLARFEHGPPRPRPTPSTHQPTPTREPHPTPSPAPSHAAPHPRHRPTPTAAPAPIPEPLPPTTSPLCALSASARTSSEAPSNYTPAPISPAAEQPAFNNIANHDTFTSSRSHIAGAKKHANPSAASLLIHAGAPPRPP